MNKFILLLLLFSNILLAEVLGGYYSAKIQGKNYHFFLSPSGSYFYQVEGKQTYFFKNEMNLGTIKKFEVYETSQMLKPKGHVTIRENLIETFEFQNIKAKNITMRPLSLKIQNLPITKQIYKNETCSFQFINLNEIENVYVFKEMSFLISEIMESFKDYNCDYLKSSRSEQIDEKLNVLKCDSEIILLKDRFYGINFMCKANFANTKDYKYQVFSVIFDRLLKFRVKKMDFTISDISAEDDSKNLEFKLTPVGLGLYSAEPRLNKEEFLRIVPYFNLKNNFLIWGKPKPYIRHFSLK